MTAASPDAQHGEVITIGKIIENTVLVVIGSRELQVPVDVHDGPVVIFRL
jgi:hypothetical protein